LVRQGGLVFALWLGGLDAFGVAAEFDGGIMQGGQREAIVATFSKEFHVLSPHQR
jgi:hypothetical protein